MRRARRIAGYALVALGGAALLIGVSPIFPVVIQAFLVGGALIGVGLWLISGRDLRARPLHAAHDPATVDPLLPERILELARKLGSTLTVSQVARELAVSAGRAEVGLEACVRAGHALPEYDVARRQMLYRFPGVDTPGVDTRPPRRYVALDAPQ